MIEGARRPAMSSGAAAIRTSRLELMPATVDSLAAARQGSEALARAFQAVVPPSWPPEFLDDAALRFVQERLGEGPQHDGWWMYFLLTAGAEGSDRTIIGTAGYAGPPSDDGTVEIGYGVAVEHQRRGYATEAVRGLVSRAFTIAAIRRVIAETLPELLPSQGVLAKTGFTQIEGSSAPGVLRYEVTRERFRAGE